MAVLHPNLHYNKVCYKGIELYFLVHQIAVVLADSCLGGRHKLEDKYPLDTDLLISVCYIYVNDVLSVCNCQLCFKKSLLHVTRNKNKSEASSTIRALSSACCSYERLYTLRIKIGTRTTSAHEHSHCLSIVELASVL